MTDNQFWLRFWALITGTICILSTSAFIYSYVTQQEIVRMVEKGANPTEAHCAVHGINLSNAAFCSQRIVK